jgi:hypothetical protein
MTWVWFLAAFSLLSIAFVTFQSLLELWSLVWFHGGEDPRNLTEVGKVLQALFLWVTQGLVAAHGFISKMCPRFSRFLPRLPQGSN